MVSLSFSKKDMAFHLFKSFIFFSIQKFFSFRGCTFLCILNFFFFFDTLHGSPPFTLLNLFVYRKAIGLLQFFFCMSPAYRVLSLLTAIFQLISSIFFLLSHINNKLILLLLWADCVSFGSMVECCFS